MGFLDDAKDKIQDLLDGNDDKVEEGVDKAADVADDKTGGEYTDQIDSGAEQAKDALGVDDPAPPAATEPPADETTPPAPPA